MSFSSIWSRLTMLRVYNRAVGLDHRVYGIGHGLRGDAALGAGARCGGGQERQERQGGEHDRGGH